MALTYQQGQQVQLEGGQGPVQALACLYNTVLKETIGVKYRSYP